MRGCLGWSNPLFFANPHNISNGFFMFHSVGQDESAHMHSLAIASTAGLYKMITLYINHVAHLMKLARIWLYYKIDNVRTS